MLYRVVHEEPDLAGVPDALAPLVHACLAKDPEERPSTVQLSERLAEIAAREARGIGAPRREALPKTAGPRPERPVGRRAEEYAQQRTRRTAQGADPSGTGGGRTASSRSPAVPPARTPVRTGGARRPGAQARGRRLLRQRLVVFVIVTLLAAVCIAAVQGCHRFSRGTGSPTTPSVAPLTPGVPGP